MKDPFTLAGREYTSRLIVGTGKYASFAETRRAIEASGAEIVTVAVRRVNITDPSKENLLDHLPPDRFTILPNTAGCYTAEDAIRTCRLAREAGVGTASHASEAMELGCDGVLMNTAIAGAKDPILMAEAMRQAVEAGRKAFLAGRIPAKLHASASSPLDGLIR